MAISITCPGCRAGFEVPETLSGKTIRCTSCKTQLTVPATAAPVATAAGAVAAKKPFGWAANPVAKPAAAPMSLDDDTPVTAAKAKPAAKPVVKTDVTLDEDEKPKPASKTGPAIKGAIKGTPKKRRDDDDDDDDDDEDDRPRRKKAAAGGSGGMIALIGGGVVALGAIVGLSIYLLSGDGEKKDDSAKTDSTTPSNPAVAPGGPGMPGTGMPGGPGMPGSGMPGGGMPGGPTGSGMPNRPGMPGGINPGGGPMPGAPGMGGSGRPNNGPGGGGFGGNSLGGLTQIGTEGAWANFTGDGFAADFPGTPENKDTTEGGMVLKITGVGHKDGNIAAVFMLQFPSVAEASQVVDVMVNAMSGKSGASATPKNVTVDGLAGKELEITKAGAAGAVRVVAAKDRVYMLLAGGNSKNGKPAMPKADITRFLNSVKITYKGDGGNIAGGGPGGPPGFPGAPAGFPGGAMQPPPGFPGIPTPGGGPGFPTPGGGPGFPTPGGPGFPGGIAGQPPIGFPGGQPGQPGGIGKPPTPGGQPGQPGPGQPPRPGGGPGRPDGEGIPGFPGGQPSGGDTNAPPTGAVADGKLKANVGAFFAAAFDDSKKEFFTVSDRQEKGKVNGWLNRFSYPKFSEQRKYKIPHLATRVVIDPAKELLYVASVNNPNKALGDQQLDQAAGVGDVEVFDLAAIRANKVEDGADLKPVATISFGKTIRGLELSTDGKSLYVATVTNTRPFKSVLHLIDTETRKVGKTKEMSEAVWDARKSADGNSLLITDMAASGKASLVRVLDLATLTESKKYSMQGVANEAAPGKAGQIAATVRSSAKDAPLKVVLATDATVRDFEFGIGWKAVAWPGYVQYSPDGKLLFVSGHGALTKAQAGGASPGLDVYEVAEADSPTGVKKKASIRTAGNETVGGHFVMSPDGEFLAFHTGAVVEAANVGGNNGEGTAIGGGVGGQPFPPGGQPFPPGGIPGMPMPGGVVPPLTPVVPGVGGGPGTQPKLPGPAKPGQPGNTPRKPPGGEGNPDDGID